VSRATPFGNFKVRRVAARSSLGPRSTPRPAPPGCQAELISQGMVQLAVEGCSPLPFIQLNTQVGPPPARSSPAPARPPPVHTTPPARRQAAVMPQGLAMAALQTVLLTPVGVLVGRRAPDRIDPSGRPRA